MSSSVLYLRIPTELHHALSLAAERDDVPMSKWVAAVLADALKANVSVSLTTVQESTLEDEGGT